MRVLARKLKAALQPAMRLPTVETPALTERERDTLYALFEVACAHPGFPRERFAGFLAARRDRAVEFRAAAALLDARAAARFKGLDFVTLTSDARDAVLGGMLRKFGYRSGHAAILDRLGLTADNFDLAFSGRAAKALRRFVVREMVVFYYDEPEGWRVVGYEKARGHAVEERGEARIVATEVRDGRRVFALDDGTFEDAETARPADAAGTVVWVKGGRQKARFAQSTQSTQPAARVPREGKVHA